MDMNFNQLMVEVFLPISIIFAVFGLPIGAFVFFRVLAHRERMALIAAGQPISGARSGTPPPMSGGAARSHDQTEPAQVTLNKGIRLALIGFAVTLGLSTITFHSGSEGISWHPGPWLLGGLVPMFVGIAQVIIGILGGATIAVATTPAPSPATQNPFAPQPPPPQAAPWMPEPFDVSSYGGRPANAQEFKPPTNAGEP